MPAQPPNPESPDTPDTPDNTNDDLYSHQNEIRALRLALSRLEAQLEQAEDPAAIVRISSAIARTSDSIVRATAHHKLALLAEKARLTDEWAELHRAVADHKALERRQASSARESEVQHEKWWRKQQEFWLTHLAAAAEEAAAGDTTRANTFVATVRARLRSGDHACPTDSVHIAAMRERDAAAAAAGSPPPWHSGP